MAITLDKASSANAASVASLQWTHTVGGANTYLLVGGGLRTGSLSTANCNNLVLTRKCRVNAGAGGEIWDLQRVPTGNLTISCVAQASVTGWAFSGISYNGVHQKNPAGTAVTATATATNLNLSLSTSTGQRVVGFIGCGSLTTVTITNPATQNSLAFVTAGATGAVGLQVSDKTAGGVTTSMSWSLSASRNVFGMAIPIDQFSASTGSATTVVLTSGTSWTVPSDFNTTANTVECWGGGGGGGGANGGSPGSGGGGGGGAYSQVTNLNLTPGSSVAYSVGAGGTPGLSVGPTAGGAGGDTWFHSTTTVLASPGLGGGNGTTQTGGAGGTTASCVGTVKLPGGSGGNSAAGTAPGGGGGAGGPDGAGSAGAAGSGTNAGAGGYGDAGQGGAGGSGGAVGGGDGEAEEVGGGGGGGDGDTTANGGGDGGLPGGGAGGGSGGVGTPGGTGGGGQVRITYVPVAAGTSTASMVYSLMQLGVGQ